MDFADRVKETTATTGAGAFTLAGTAPAGYRTFGASLSAGATVPYCASLGAEWEIGIGTLTGPTTLARTIVTASSDAGALVNFSAGAKDIFVVAPAAAIGVGITDQTDVGYDIVACMGQSNMVGRGAIDALIDMADSRVMQFGGASAQARYRTIFSGASPTHNAEALQTTCSPQSAFGAAYASTRPPHRRVLLVPCAYGGTTLVTPSFNSFATAPWSAGSPGGDLYENAITQVNLALAAARLTYPNSRVVGAIWHQGESDADNYVAQAPYAAALSALIAGFRARVTGAASSWFVIGGMMPERIAAHSGYPPIAAAHQQVANETSKCTFVAGPSGYAADTYHYTAAGSRILGARMALAVQIAARYVAVDAAPPSALSAAVANATPTVVRVSLSEALNTSFVPPASAFTVGGHTVSSVLVGLAYIDLTVGSPFVYGEAARTVAYTQPGANNARDAAGNLMANFSGLVIANNIATVPATMAAPVATAGMLSASIAFVAPANGGAAITGYTVTASTGQTATGATSPISVTMPADVSVTFTVRATNSAGSGAASPASNSVTPSAAATAPSAPTIGAVTAGNNSITISFTPGATGGSPITGYTATASTGQTASGTASPLTITGLAAGTAATVTVTATNGVGTSAPSAASNSATPTAAVFATWNPADKSSILTLSNGDKTVTGTSTSTSTWCGIRSTIGKASGKWYWEVTVGAGVQAIGIGTAGDTLANYPGFSANGVGYYSVSGAIFKNNANTASGPAVTFTAGDVIGVAYDADTSKVGFFKNGVQVSTTAMYAVPAGTLFAMVASRELGAPAATTTTNFGASAFAYTPPSGHVGLA